MNEHSTVDSLSETDGLEQDRSPMNKVHSGFRPCGEGGRRQERIRKAIKGTCVQADFSGIQSSIQEGTGLWGGQSSHKPRAEEGTILQ